MKKVSWIFANWDCLSAETYGIDRFKGSWRIKAMNRRLQRELGYDAVEMVGHRGVLRDFMDDIWDCEKGEMGEKT